MADYIRREDAIEFVFSLVDTMSVCTNKDECIGMKSMKSRALSAIRDVPVANVRDNTPSSWKYNFNQNRFTARISCTVTCRHCHITRDRLFGDVLKYCPNCGAPMRGEKDERD